MKEETPLAAAYQALRLEARKRGLIGEPERVSILEATRHLWDTMTAEELLAVHQQSIAESKPTVVTPRSREYKRYLESLTTEELMRLHQKEIGI